MNIRLPNAAPSKQDPGLGPRVPEASGPTQLPALGSAEFFRTFGQMPPDATAAAATPSVADTKRATVAENAEAKQLLLGGADEFRRLGTAIREGNDLADDEAARIIAGGNPYDILTHLGPDALGQVEPLYRQMRDDAFALDQGRTTGEITGDALLGIGAGAVSGLGGLAALGAGAINDRAGAVVSEGVDWAAGGLRGLQSQELQDQREIGAVRSSLDQDDIDRQYQRDVEAEVSYPGLRRFGREAIAAGADLLDNPALAGDLVAEGVGSLVGGGGLGRVAAVGGARLLLRTRGIVGQSATAFLRSAEGRRMVAELAERGMPLSIGGLEAGGAYVGIQGEIQAMDEGELLENSPEYRELRTEGLGHEDARDRIANLAGLEGGAIAGLVGVATGSLVARFEANPLNLGRRALPASRSMVDSLRSIGRESLAQGVEEGVQGAAGSLAQNLAIRDYADESRDLTRGMGAEALRGAVAGVGMVAPLRAPDLAFGLGNDLTRGAVEGAKAAGRAASTAIDGRLRNVEAGIDARSPVGRNAFDQAMTTLGMGLQTVRESVQESIAGRAPEPDLQDLAERAQAVLSLDPESLRDAVRMMESGELSQEDEADTALDIYQRAEQLGWITEQDLGKLTPEARAAMREVRKAVNIAVSNPTVAAAVRRAQTIVSSKDLGTLPDVTLASADTPEVQKVLTATVRLAEANPAGIDPRFVKQVLNQRNGLKLSDAVRAKLEAAALIVREMERADRQKAQILTATEAELARRGLSEKPRKTTDMVRQEILNTGGKDPYKQYSLSRHQSEIVGAIEHGDRKIAQDRFDALGNFAHHMGNKVVAAEQSAALKKSRDNTVLFRTWTGVKWLEASEKGASGIFINPFSPNNIQLLKELRVDAATVKSVYNNLLSIYGPTAGLQGERFGNSGSNTGTTHAEPREAMDDQDEIVAQEANGELRAEGQGEAHRLKPESEQADPGPAEGATRNGDDRILPEGAEPDPRDDGGEPETGADPETVSEESQADTEGETEGETTEATANETLNKTLVQSGPNFGNLASVGGTTPKFARTFDIDPEASPLIAEEAPARKVLEILRDGSSKDERFTLPHFVDKGQIQAWDRVIAREGQALIQRVNDKLRSRDKGILKNLKGMTPLEALDQALVGQGSVNWLDYRDTLGLNLVAPATQAYDARLVQLAMLASLHWFMTTPGTQNLDDDEVAKVFGRSVSDVTEAMRRAANSGRGVKPSVESLARVIRDFWGATPKPDAPISDVRGLSEHMAIQFLDAMDGEDGEDGEAGKFTTSQTFEIPDGDGKTVTARVIYLRNEATSKLRDDVKASKSLLGDMFVPKTAKPLYFGRPPEERRTTQKGNALSPLGEKMRAALKVQRETPFYRNQPQVQMMKALGQDTWFALMGFRAVNEARVNVIDRLSIEGLNNSIRDSWDGVMGYDAQLDAYAEAQAQNPAEVPVHFDFYAASNERMMIEGFNPQADKAMREVAVATRSRLNLLDEKQHEAFWLTVGQSSGLVETEKGSRTANAAAAESKIRARFPESIAILESWLADTTRPLDLEARRVLTSEIRSALGAKNASPKLMHALLSVARYDQVMADTVPGDSEAAENFEHALSLEADGKTDGPINAIVNFTTGKFSADWVLNVRRGGFFPNEQGQTLNGQFDRDDHDLYKLAGVRANALFAERRLHLARTTAGSQMIGALQRVLGILGDVEIGDDGTVQITRKGIKNPLTITGYGSGEKGIAGKVTSAMLERLYAAMTRMEEQRVTYGNQQVGLDAALPGMASLDQFRKDLSLLTRRRLIPNRERGWVLVPTNQKGQEAGPLMNLNDGRNFKLSPEQFSILQANIQVGYVKPMRRAIAEVFGNAQRTLNLFQQTTQIQSLVLKDLFWKRVKDLRAARKVSGELTAGQFLSQEDFQKISEDLKKYGAFIEPVDSNESSLNLSIAEGEQTTVEFSRDFDGRYAGGSTLPAPRLAGVSASPMVTISRGDAKMMVSFFGDEGALEAGARRTLQVYDGLEMPADLIETLSERINKAVADAWLESPAKDVAESFSDWIRQGKDGPLGEVSDDAVGAIIEILGVKPEDASTAISRDDVNAALLNLEDELSESARSIEARKAVLKRISFSVDHMASGETPYVKTGEGWDGEGRFIDWLNALYAEELAKLEPVGLEKRGAVHPAVEPADKGLLKLIQKTGTRVRLQTSSGKPKGRIMTRLSMDQMLAVLDNPATPGMSEESHRVILRELARVMPDYTFMVGDRTMLGQWRAVTHPELEDPMDIDFGQTDPQLGVIFVANAAAETILHEMLHGALGTVLTNHYAGIGKALSGTQTSAIRNLERLMRQFADMDFSLEDPATRKAAAQVQMEIRNWLGEGFEYLNQTQEEGGDLLVLRRAGALSEFIAWTLTNQNLRKVLSKSKVRVALIKLKDAVLDGLRKLLGFPERVPLDVFSNIAWNAGALVHTLESYARQQSQASLSLSGPLLNQRNPDRAASPSVDRMRDLRRSFEAKVGVHLRSLPVSQQLIEDTTIYTLADAALNRFHASGFRFTPEQASTFRVIQAALASSMKIAPGAMAQTQKVFEHFMKDLSVESLMKDRTNDFERSLAEDKFNAIVGKTGTEWDRHGRSNLLSSVLALAMVDEDFRKVLEQSELPKDRSIRYTSVDEFLTSAGESLINTLGTAISEDGRLLGGTSNTREALDRLAQVLSRIESDDRGSIEKQAYQAMDGSEAKARSLMEGLGSRLADWGSANRVENPRSLRELTQEGLRASARLLAGVVSHSRGQAMAEAMVGFANEARSPLVPTAFKELLAEVVGVTDWNRGVLSLVNRVKFQVSALRQDYREKLPEILGKQFSRPLDDDEWSALHLGLGKTDLAALGQTFSVAGIRKMLKEDSALDDALNVVEEEIRNASSRRQGATILKKASELALFMATGRVDPSNQNLLKNATTIANLFGEKGQAEMAKQGGASDALIQAVDQYASLRALEIVRAERPDVWDRLSRLAQDEPEGFDFLLYSLFDLRKTEGARLNTDAARMNAWKGYIPEEVPEGARLIASDDREHNKLVSLGFSRLGDYQGSGYDSGSWGYYYSSVGGSNPYAQGVLQTIQRTAMGADPMNGRTVMGSGVTGGVIAGRDVVTIQTLMRSHGNQGGRSSGEPLIPIYDAKGQVVAYERSMLPEMRAKLRASTHMGQMMGAWAGRQQEESLAQAFNELLIDRLKEAWEDGKRTKRRKEFVNLAESSQAGSRHDEVFGESWNMIPPETKAYIDQVFGEDGFMVRRDMVNNALGYRMPSVKDAWEGASRLDPRTRRMIRDASTVVIGSKALTVLTTAEKLWAAGISMAKNTIVVRSVIVPLSNMTSNVLQLMARGVGVREIWKGMPAKLVEISQFLKNRDREIEIRALMARHRADTLRTLKLDAELKSLEDATMRMSIWPLIEVGEFSTISEGQTEVDAAISGDKWSEYLQNTLEKVPARLGTLGRYAVVTRDTALFRGMNRAVQYGDFLAKAVLYDHLVEQKKLKPEEAIAWVSEEFVNYNLLPGRTRSYLESMGLTWFWAYKLRSMKVALNMVRENPLRTLLMTHGAEYLPNMPGVSVGSPLSDNAASVVLEGRADYSLGLDMLWAAPGLNPWVNLGS